MLSGKWSMNRAICEKRQTSETGMKIELHLASAPKATEDPQSHRLSVPGLPRFPKGINTADHRNLSWSQAGAKLESGLQTCPARCWDCHLAICPLLLGAQDQICMWPTAQRASCHRTLNSLYHGLNSDTATNPAEPWWLCSLSGTCI